MVQSAQINLCVGVCGTYVVHDFNGTERTIGLHCVPPTCVVHHGAQGRLDDTCMFGVRHFTMQFVPTYMYTLVVHNVALY